ncbi:hypothetical protein COBT_003058 [Conglomerata obtusa]
MKVFDLKYLACFVVFFGIGCLYSILYYANPSDNNRCTARNLHNSFNRQNFLPTDLDSFEFYNLPKESLKTYSNAQTLQYKSSNPAIGTNLSHEKASTVSEISVKNQTVTDPNVIDGIDVVKNKISDLDPIEAVDETLTSEPINKHSSFSIKGLSNNQIARYLYTTQLNDLIEEENEEKYEPDQSYIDQNDSTTDKNKKTDNLNRVSAVELDKDDSKHHPEDTTTEYENTDIYEDENEMAKSFLRDLSPLCYINTETSRFLNPNVYRTETFDMSIADFCEEKTQNTENADHCKFIISKHINKFYPTCAGYQCHNEKGIFRLNELNYKYGLSLRNYLKQITFKAISDDNYPSNLIYINSSENSIFGVDINVCESIGIDYLPIEYNNLKYLYGNYRLYTNNLSESLFFAIYKSAIFVFNHDGSAFLLIEKANNENDQYEELLLQWQKTITNANMNENEYFGDQDIFNQFKNQKTTYINDIHTAALYDYFHPFSINYLSDFFNKYEGSNSGKFIKFFEITQTKKESFRSFNVYHFKTISFLHLTINKKIK